MYIELQPVFAAEGTEKPFAYEYSVDDDAIIGNVKVSGRVFNKTGIVWLEGVAIFDYSAECAKCGKPILRHTEVPVKHILVVHLENENDDDDDMYIVVENMRLNLDELVSEDIFLSVPTRFLCKENCKGLCSLCGADLNEGDCGCKKPVDSRWAALTELMNE